MLKGAVYGFVAAIILWLILSGIVALTFGSLERVILISGVGITIWGITWSIAGAIIGFVGLKNAKWKLIGSVCGAVIGLISVILAIIWPRCDYGNMIDKVLWATPMAIEMPVFSLLYFMDKFLQKIFNLSIYQGDKFVILFLILSSVILWGIFGMMLGKLIGREAKNKLR